MDKNMSANLILEAVKTAVQEGKATVNLTEASTLTGSGSGVGGRVIYDDSFAALRYANPLRGVSRVIDTIGSDQAFVVKTGNATLIQNGSNNPWGYPINSNTGSPDILTSFWQLPIRALNATVPVRTAILADINALAETIAMDLALEFSQQEALSMMFNNDQSGSTTVNFGATSGLRGLNSYAGSTSAASFGTSGSAITNGLHTVLQVAQAANTAVTYDDLANLLGALPSQYLYKETTCWMMHPTTIQALRKLKASTTANNFLEVGDSDGGAVVYIFGHCVIPNPYMDVTGAGKYPVYIADWERFFTIADRQEMSIQMIEQAQVGFMTFFGEKRVASTIRDVFAGVRLVGPA
jgi:HK97 family phage major capsid protein